ncbi:MAG: dihydrofolate reductase [Verrucomicrobiota bacterium]
MKVSMISAMATGRVIGTGSGGIPWRLPRDSAHFRGYTQGKHMLLGRTTFEEMDGWFTTQVPVVLTRNAEYEVAVPGGGVALDVESAIRYADEAGAAELVVSGGASVYAAALAHADELVLTFVDAEVEGGAFFPDWEANGEWEEVSREAYGADEENEYGMSFVVLRRV